MKHIIIVGGGFAGLNAAKALGKSGQVRVTLIVIHIYFLTGFKNRLFVVLNWAWSYMTFRRGARLIIDREWEERGK